MNSKQVILIGITLGVTAALVVWWLERFESRRMFGEMGQYLSRYDQFRDWERDHGN